MINDDFDKKIFNYFKENKEVPKKTIDSIYNLNLSKNRISIIYNIKKVAITIISLLTISTGVVFADEISEFIANLFFDSEGVNTAVENGYIYNVPETIYSESNYTTSRIKQMLMDDYTLDLSMMIELDETINITNYDKIKFPDLIITDENNNILYNTNTEVLNKYNFEYNKVINTSSSSFITSADMNYIHFNYILSSSDTPFPKSKKINVKFSTIEITNSNTNTTYVISGNWKNTLNVPTNFYNRETYIYNLVKCNNENIYNDSIKCTVSATCTKFEMYMNWENYEETKKLSQEKREENILNSLLIKNNAYIENDNGEKFYISKSSDSDGGYGVTSDNKFKYWQTFDLTQFNLTPNLKIVLTTIYDEPIILELIHTP